MACTDFSGCWECLPNQLSHSRQTSIAIIYGPSDTVIIRYPWKVSALTQSHHYDQVLQQSHAGLETPTFSPDYAGKLRGDFCWFLSSIYAGYTGRVGRLLWPDRRRAVSLLVLSRDCLHCWLLTSPAEPRESAVCSVPPCLCCAHRARPLRLIHSGWAGCSWGNLRHSQGHMRDSIPCHTLLATTHTQLICPEKHLCGLCLLRSLEYTLMLGMCCGVLPMRP